MAVVKFLKTENLTENVSKFCIRQALMTDWPASIPCRFPYIIFLLEFWGIFFFKNLTSATSDSFHES